MTTHPHLEGLIRKWRERAEKAGLDARDNDDEGVPSDWDWAKSHYFNKCAAELEAALAALPGGGGDGWQPIESIPRDESRVELLSANGKTDTGNFCLHVLTEPSDDIQDHLNTDNGEGNYTHWRPLSPTPTPHEADRNG